MSSLVLTPTTELSTDLKNDVFALEQAGRAEGAFSIEAAARLSVDAELQHLDSIYHSDLAAAISAVPDRSSVRPAAQWATWLSANTAKLGVRQEEIEWSGISDYLSALGTQRVSRAQLLSYLVESGIKLGEVEKGRELVSAMQDDIARREYGKSFDALGARAAQHVRSLVDAMPLASQYDAFVLPGGENYRELLITLRGDSAAKRPIGNHTGTHWAEKNVIAHVRFDERSNVDGEKVLFLHEIQSDWAQDGRQKGFESARQGMTPQERSAIIAHYDGLLREMPKIFFPLTDVVEMMRAMGTMEISKALLAAGLPDSSVALHPNSNSIPDGPFVTRTEAWVGLAIKRMLKYAVDHGFERVALISGQQSADRFDLSTTVTSVRATRTFLGHYQLEVRAKDGKVVVDDVVVPERLRSIVGRELAAKIEEGEDKQHYRGLNIPVGGDGMKAFYDEIVPQVAKQVLRKLGGGELGEVVIAEENGGKYVLRKPDGTYVRDAAGIYPYSSKRAAQQKAAQFARNGEKGYVVEPAPMAGGQQLCIHIDDALRASLQGGAPMFSRDAAQAQMFEPAPAFASPDTASPEFSDWFGDSVARMDDGVPLRLYHGTSAYFSEFRPSESGSYGAGIYLTPDTGAAELFAGGEDGHVIVPVFIRLERPYHYSVTYDDLEGLPAYSMLYDILSQEEADAIVAEDEYDVDYRVTEALQEMGHDGVIVTFPDGGKEYLVFEAEQVKSALTNTGDFDPDNADIRFSRQRGESALENFMAGSKVVKDGKPLVAYHGTSKDFKKFSKDKIGSNYGADEVGFFFASNPANAEHSAMASAGDRGRPHIMPVYLSLKAPHIVELSNAPDGVTVEYDRHKREYLAAAQAAKADGIIVTDGEESIYVAFEPEQIKSAVGNNGDFDPAKADIRFQRDDAGLNLSNPADSTGMFNPATVDGLRATRFKSREKMINMPIADFLRLAEAGGGEFKANRVAQALEESGYFNDIPYLKIERDGVLARVYGHEGRHRARALQARGYTHMPVVLSSSDIRWSEQGGGNQYDYIATWPASLVGQNGDVLPFPVSRESAGKDFSIDPVPNQVVPTIGHGAMGHGSVVDQKNGSTNGCAVYAVGVACVNSFGVGKDASVSPEEKESIKGLAGAESILAETNDPTNGSQRASQRAPVKPVRKVSDHELDAVRALAAAFGSEVVVFRQSATSKLRFNGAKHGKNIWLNEQSSQPLHTVFGHELLHMMKSDRPDLYKSLYEALSGLLRDDAVYAEQAGLAGHGADYVHEEMIADLLGDQFAERGFWDQVASRSGTAFTGIVSFVSGAIDKVRNSVFGADRQLSSGADRFVRDLDQARGVLAGAVAEYLADKRAGFFEGVEASAARIWPAGAGIGFDRMEVAAALLENIDEDVSAVYAETVGGRVTYGAVFDWLDGPALANPAAPHVGQLLEIARRRGVEVDQRAAGNLVQKRFDEALSAARGAEKSVSGVEMGVDARI